MYMVIKKHHIVVLFYHPKYSPFPRISGKTVAQRLPDYVHILADCSPVAEGGPNCRVSLIVRRGHEHTPIPTEMIEKASDFVHSQRLLSLTRVPFQRKAHDIQPDGREQFEAVAARDFFAQQPGCLGRLTPRFLCTQRVRKPAS